MKNHSWDWEPRNAYTDVDPQKVGAEIDGMGATVLKEFSLDTKAIVEKAKDPGTELHKCFTWDDKEAAELWRRLEASKILKRLVMVVCHNVGCDECDSEI